MFPASLGSGSGGRMTHAVGVGAIVGAGSSAAECATSLTNANVSAMTNVHQEGNRVTDSGLAAFCVEPGD
jgi:hypothetical protein